jgi:hypothetical protein
MNWSIKFLYSTPLYPHCILLCFCKVMPSDAKSDNYLHTLLTCVIKECGYSENTGLGEKILVHVSILKSFILAYCGLTSVLT